MSHFMKQVSLHGQRAYLTARDILVGRAAIAAGGERSVGRQGGNIILPGSPAYVADWDEFLGDVLDDRWSFTGADTGAGGSVRPFTNGVFRMALSATSAKTPAGAAVLNTGLFPQWKANQGQLRLAARLKIDSLTGANVFIGFADTGARQMAVYDTGGGILSPASNAVGLLFGGGAALAPANQVWRGVAVNTDVDATPVSGTAPVANTYDVLEVALNDAGNVATFYQNGASIGRIQSPVLATRGMVPVLSAFASEAGANNIDLDWINVSALRDTGE
jgi:hypothetical protein